MFIKGEKCSLRNWKLEDAVDLARIANNPKIAQNMMDLFPHPYTVDYAKKWIKSTVQRGFQKNFAISIDHELAGSIGFNILDKDKTHTAELSYWLGEEYWKRGAMTEAVSLMTKYTFKYFNILRIEGKVYTWNPASARVLLKAGYFYEGRHRGSTQKCGRIVDEWIYSKTRHMDDVHQNIIPAFEQFPILEAYNARNPLM